MAAADHYSAVADVYEMAWCYKTDDPFHRWFLDKVQAALPKPCKTIVDVGCGTGNFSCTLRDVTGSVVTGVEPSAEMAAKGVAQGLQVEVIDAESWAAKHEDSSEAKFDAILLKEVRHHIENPEGLYRDIAANKIAPGGRLLLLTRPDKSEGYPFPAKAHEHWAAGNLVPLMAHQEALTKAGFHVTVEENRYPVHLKRAEWEHLLRARFWSNLSPLTHEEMEEGLQALALPEEVHFEVSRSDLIEVLGDEVARRGGKAESSLPEEFDCSPHKDRDVTWEEFQCLIKRIALSLQAREKDEELSRSQAPMQSDESC